MATEDGAVWIALNGEIYNFQDLRAELEAAGCRFRSKSDTEVLLALYARDGTACFRRLNGMFAVALLDRRRGKIVLARDHFGIKPLYYHEAGGRLVFGSEIKAILASGAYAVDVNWQALSDYLTYLYVPCPDTIFRDVAQVPPAHVLEYDLTTRRTELWPYWELPLDGHPDGKARVEDDRLRLRALLTDSVARQMVSDVPLGIFLSGGVDSRILTGLMAQASSRPVKSFTVVFEGKRVEAYNEQRAARATAQRFGTEHHELTVDITTPDDLLDVMSRFDQPFGNPTAYLTYLIARHTRREVTVALSGAGGDELFAGYPRYRAAALARWALRVPGPVRRATQRALELLPDDRRGGRRHRLRRFLGGLDRDFPTQFVKWTYFLDEADKARLLAGGGAASGILAADRVIRHHLDSSALRDVGNRMLYADVRTFLLDNILEYSDKMTMAVGLEGRVPYLDPRVVEHAMRVPFASKLRGGQGKRILREAFADLLDGPDEGKRGFNAPLGVWVRDVLDPYFDEHMDRQTVRAHGIFDWERIEVLRGQHRRGERDNSYELFAIIVFDVWFRAHLLGAPVGAAR
jgi:asparagine synthase (glutamine-hydrolysing)